MQTLAVQSDGRSWASELRRVAMTWGLSAVLPLPVLVATPPDTSAGIACLYLGLSCGWLAVEMHRAGSATATLRHWRSRQRAIAVAVLANVALFVMFGLAGGVRTHFPLPLMACLSAVPAIGMTPWLLRRSGQPYAAILLGAVIVLACKLAACAVARVVYGPDALALGYMAADWRTAKLMISLFWTLTTLVSSGMLLVDYHATRREIRAAHQA